MTAQRFVLELGRAMHALGSPAYRVEDTMDACCRALGLEGAFFATPTAIFAAIGAPGSEPHTTLSPVGPSDHDLADLDALYAIRDEVVRHRIPPEEGLRRLRAVMTGTPHHGPLAELLAYGLAGAGGAVLFGGSAVDVAVGGSAGLLAGGLAVLSRGRPRFGDVLPAVACAVVAFAVHLAAGFGVPTQVPLATLAAVVVLLPGLSFTTALAELAMRHLSAGSARLLGTLAVLLTMAIGVGIGNRTAELVVGPAPAVPAAAPGLGWLLVGIGITWVAYLVLLRVARHQAVWVLLGVGIGYGGARFGRELLGPEMGPFLGALAVSIAANLFARWQRRPAAVVRTPGLLLLVPGSLGFRGLTTALDRNFTDSAQFAFQMLLVGGAIVAGMLMAGVLVPPPLDVEPDSRRRPPLA